MNWARREEEWKNEEKHVYHDILNLKFCIFNIDARIFKFAIEVCLYQISCFQLFLHAILENNLLLIKAFISVPLRAEW